MISDLTLLPYFDNPDPELDTMVIIHFRLLHHVYGNLSQTLLKSQNLLKFFKNGIQPFYLIYTICK